VCARARVGRPGAAGLWLSHGRDVSLGLVWAMGMTWALSLTALQPWVWQGCDAMWAASVTCPGLPQSQKPGVPEEDKACAYACALKVHTRRPACTRTCKQTSLAASPTQRSRPWQRLLCNATSPGRSPCAKRPRPPWLGRACLALRA